MNYVTIRPTEVLEKSPVKKGDGGGRRRKPCEMERISPTTTSVPLAPMNRFQERPANAATT
jgi:hypothetical protein